MDARSLFLTREPYEVFWTNGKPSYEMRRALLQQEAGLVTLHHLEFHAWSERDGTVWSVYRVDITPAGLAALEKQYRAEHLGKPGRKGE